MSLLSYSSHAVSYQLWGELHNTHQNLRVFSSISLIYTHKTHQFDAKVIIFFYQRKTTHIKLSPYFFNLLCHFHFLASFSSFLVFWRETIVSFVIDFLKGVLVCCYRSSLIPRIIYWSMYLDSANWWVFIFFPFQNLFQGPLQKLRDYRQSKTLLLPPTDRSL